MTTEISRIEDSDGGKWNVKLMGFYATFVHM